MRSLFSTSWLVGMMTMNLPPIELLPSPYIHGPRNRSKRRRNGNLYPHSSTRQQARYARQIAAGQLSMAGIGKRVK